MSTDLTQHPRPLTVDLTGLPEPVVRQVTQLVREAREKQPAAPATFPAFISRPRPSAEESKRLLDEMAAMGTGQSLPPDWSRADLYDDHD